MFGSGCCGRPRVSEDIRHATGLKLYSERKRNKKRFKSL